VASEEIHIQNEVDEGVCSGRRVTLWAGRMTVRRKVARHPAHRGFTLVELLVAMAVLMTIVAIAIPNMVSSLNQARIARAVGDIAALQTDIAGYEATNGGLPNSLADIGRDGFLDPWGNPYVYLNHSTAKGKGQMRKDRFLVPLNSDYDLYSVGQDGKSSSPITAKDSQDDIIRASDGAYIGLASNF
jgi:general secretion pathway protein G